MRKVLRWAAAGLWRWVTPYVDDGSQVNAVAQLPLVLFGIGSNAPQLADSQRRVGVVAILDMHGAKRLGLAVGVKQALLPIGLGGAIFAAHLPSHQLGKARAANAQGEDGVAHVTSGKSVGAVGPIG